MNKEDLKNKFKNVKETVKDTFHKDTGNADVENIKTDLKNRDYSGAMDKIKDKTGFTSHKTDTVKPDINRKVS